MKTSSRPISDRFCCGADAIDTRIMVAIMLLAAVAGMYFFGAGETPAPTVDEAARTDSFYMKKLVLTSFDPEGRQRSVLHAEALEQSSSTGDSTLHHPALELVDDDGGVWRMTAIRGEMDAAMDHAHLRGDVKVVAERNPLATLNTPALQVDIDSRVLTSDVGVVVRQGRNRIESKTLTADLSQDKVQLSGSVRGVYVP